MSACKANNKRKAAKFRLDLCVSGANLMELRFADDVVLMAQQRSDIEKMLAHLAASAARFGLQINLGKTKILARNNWSKSCKAVQVSGQEVEVLDAPLRLQAQHPPAPCLAQHVVDGAHVLHPALVILFLIPH